jgi:hypothetical protein
MGRVPMVDACDKRLLVYSIRTTSALNVWVDVQKVSPGSDASDGRVAMSRNLVASHCTAIPCIASCSTAYFSCVLYRLEALFTFPDAAGFPAEQGTYSATFGTGPGMRPMPGLRVSHRTLDYRRKACQVQRSCLGSCVESSSEPKPLWAYLNLMLYIYWCEIPRTYGWLIVCE